MAGGVGPPRWPACLLAWAGLGAAGGSQLTEGSVFQGSPAGPGGTRLRTVSWNVAAVNNNPFEYWITHPNPAYKQLMVDVEKFIVDPGPDDVQIDELFTPKMFQQLRNHMREFKMSSADELLELEKMWENDYRRRRVVSEFLTDALIGKKRLASMPDRVTNTIQLEDGGYEFRPAVSNCYAEAWSSLDDWWKRWLVFFFETRVKLDSKGDKPVYTLLPTIKSRKYPDVTAQEEKLSKPLQLLVQAIFDTVLVDLMSKRGGSNWQEVSVPADGWESGDLLGVVSKLAASGSEVALASFHGDTNGLLTMPMLTKVAEHFRGKPLLFGMDANTYEKESKKTAHVLKFEQTYRKLGFQASWGKANPKLYTTFNARTYLQPQLNKAAKSGELVKKGDRNPKDFILFTEHFSCGRVWRDNTGEGKYLEDTVFPTLQFPSDHAAIAADIVFASETVSEGGKGPETPLAPAAGKGREPAPPAAGKGRQTKPEL
ncbi:unnamed protein product [Prorocentrum cordatum]|uniref:Sphingomyelin phosphodiesterase n=1 Tax=Prorocentrum cordatum TaxID=2364126 RepID=A0ABN9U3C4_9DINO|nr:unnamed protein product [Polarella glacialis]